MGANDVRTYSSTGAMRETVVSGENVLAINIIGSYALDWVKDTPNPGAAFGTDYTEAFSRIAIITKRLDARRVGKECVSPSRARWSPEHSKQNSQPATSNHHNN